MGASQSTSAAHADSADLVAPLVSVDEGPLLPVNPGVGLTSAEVEARLAKYGFNEVQTQRPHPFVKLLQKMWGPMPWLIELAAVVSAALGDMKDLAFLLLLLIVNGLLAFVEEHKADDAIDALKASLAPRARVHRDGQWRVVDARELVPDDTILLRLGDVVPADAALGGGEAVEIDQSALTGEALPVIKAEGDLVYQGSVVRRGELHAIVTVRHANLQRHNVPPHAPLTQPLLSAAAAVVNASCAALLCAALL